MPEPVECEMAHPRYRQNRVSDDMNKMWYVADHVWLVDNCIEFLENNDCCGAEGQVNCRHSPWTRAAGRDNLLSGNKLVVASELGD